jgi:hypothetical protein
MAKSQLNEMKSLINRMENPQSGWATLLQEELGESRELVTANDYYDMFDDMEDENGGKWVTVGYVTGVDLNVPKVQRINPASGRMKGYPDWETFSKEIGQEQTLAGVLSVQSFQVNWMPRKNFGAFYDKYVQDANAIRADYGLEPMAQKSSNEEVPAYGNGGVSSYVGDNEDKVGNTYAPKQNVAKIKKKRTYYPVYQDGSLGKAIDKTTLVNYFKAKSPVSGVSALRKLGVEEEKIAEYVKRISDLGVSINKFETSQVLYLSAMIGGKEKTFVNDQINNVVNHIDVPVNKQDIARIAIERYKKDVPDLTDPTKFAIAMEE